MFLLGDLPFSHFPECTVSHLPTSKLSANKGGRETTQAKNPNPINSTVANLIFQTSVLCFGQQIHQDTDVACAVLGQRVFIESCSQRYCVVTSFTIIPMIREPRGHTHRSMLGFLILSCSSWSSSQRSSFTSSATYRAQ